jgi:ParB family chromosome partitioning protein
VSDKRRGLGRGLGALIPSSTTPLTRPVGERPVRERPVGERPVGERPVRERPVRERPVGERPVDVFFPDRDGEGPAQGDQEHPQGHELTASLVDGSASTATPGNVTVLAGLGVAGAAAPLASVPGPLSGTARTGSTPLGPSPVSRSNGDLASTARRAPVPPVPGLGVPGSSSTLAPATGTGPAATGPAATEAETSGAQDTDASDVAGELGDLLPVPGAYFAEIPIAVIRPNPRQPRQSFDEDSLAELVQSVKEIGILQPVVVRRLAGAGEGEDAAEGPHFELVMGERRLRACHEAGLDRIPAIVRDTQDDAMLRDALLENLHRTQLNPLEEAAAYQQLLDDFGCTHEELATRIGRSRPQISNTLRLLKLPPLVQRRVAASVLSAGHARALLGLEDAAAMERLAQRIVAEGLSVRAVEEIVALGDGTVTKPAKRRTRVGTNTPELNDLAARLGDRLDTKVAIALGRSKGRVSIEFASVEDLNRIIGLLSPEVRGAFHQS